VARTVSNVIAVLALLAVAVVAVVAGYTIVSSYLSKSLKPEYDVSVAYAKLVYITDCEVVDGETYTTFRVEVGVANPGPPTTLRICVVSAKRSNSHYTATTFTGPLSCPSVRVEPGYNVYTVILRVRNRDLHEAGCGYEEYQCPIRLNWHILVLDRYGKPVAVVKPVYIIP